MFPPKRSILSILTGMLIVPNILFSQTVAEPDVILVESTESDTISVAEQDTTETVSIDSVFYMKFLYPPAEPSIAYADTLILETEALPFIFNKSRIDLFPLTPPLYKKYYLSLEERGVPLILDADAIYLAREQVFHGNAILTPHTGEFAAYTGLPQAEILADPAPVLRRFAAEKNAYILFKSHVLYIAAPDGRLGIIDGMSPVLAAGGSGDVLAGFCAAISARQGNAAFDGYVCACAAAALLVEAARKPAISGRFIDPGELADAAASIAGKAWLRPDREGRVDE